MTDIRINATRPAYWAEIRTLLLAAMLFFTFTDDSDRDLSAGLHGGPADAPTALESQPAEEPNV